MKRIVALVLAALAVACTSPAPRTRPGVTPRPVGPAPQGTIRLGYGKEPPTLDPVSALGASMATRDVLRPVWPALFRLDGNGQWQPELADKWTSAPSTITITLRQTGWSDGEPILADDVVFSLAKLKAGPTGNRYRFVSGARAIDPKTVELTFARPVKRWKALFSGDDGILPAHAYGDGWDRAPTVGGGPFSVEGWTAGLLVRLRRNPHYALDPRPAAEAIEVIFVPDDEDRLQLLGKGELDIVHLEGGSNQGARARARTSHVSSAWGSSWWEIDMRIEPKLAEAVTSALDRRLAAETAEDSAQAIDGIPESLLGDRPWAGPWPGPAAASGVKGKDLTLVYPSDGGAASIARLLHFRLKDAGVFVELIGVERDAFEREWLAGGRASMVIVMRRGTDAPDADAYRSDAPVFRNPAKVSKADAAIDAWQTDAGEWSAVQSALIGSVLPVMRVRTWLAWRDGISGPDATGTAAGPLWNAASWRTQTSH